MSDFEWGILDDIGPAKLVMAKALMVFTSGAGGYVCVESMPDGSHRAHVWFSNREPRYDVQLWPTVDTWIVLGFEE